VKDLTRGRTPRARALREERVEMAVLALASEGGYEAVQMREVARVADVSLSTLYRYYASKDDLIIGVISRQIQRLREDVENRPPTERSAHGRAAAVFLRSFRAFERNPGFAHAAVSSYLTPIPFGAMPPPVSSDTAYTSVAAVAAWGPDHEPTKDQARALRILSALWNASLVSWLNGQLSSAEVATRLRFAAQLMLGQDPAPLTEGDDADAGR
jgi:AcrR family transcriptional regulator